MLLVNTLRHDTLGSRRASRVVCGALAANYLWDVNPPGQLKMLSVKRSVRRGAGRCTRGRVRSPDLLRWLGVILVILAPITAHAAEVIPPKPARYFNDYANVVSQDAAQRFDEQLEQFERDTSNQVVVAVFPKMETDSDVADYTQRIAQTWGVGQKDRRNGVVLFVFVQDRKMFIQVGYGLEGALPDATAFDITEFRIKPHFKTNDYEGGLAVGIDSILQAIRGEYQGTGRTNAERNRTTVDHGVWIPVAIFLIIIFINVMTAKRRRRGYRYSSFGGPFTGGWSGGSGGGWSSGGGGGFSGGGGSFGGGGAGSSW